MVCVCFSKIGFSKKFWSWLESWSGKFTLQSDSQCLTASAIEQSMTPSDVIRLRKSAVAMRGNEGNGTEGWKTVQIYSVSCRVPLRPVLSLPGRSYQNFNKILALWFDKIEGANIEAFTKEAREIIEKSQLDSDENAEKKLFEHEKPPNIARKTNVTFDQNVRKSEVRTQIFIVTSEWED